MELCEAASVNPVDRHVGEQLRLRRQELGRDAGEVARAVGLTPDGLQRIEDGLDRASAEQLMRLCRELEMRPADLYRDRGDPGL